jgi:secreted trypsin-like serine protease
MFVASCAIDMDSESAEQQPIVNGTPTADYLEVVRVIGAGTNGGACTGTVIGQQTVLTAAHCVFGGATATVAGTMRICEGRCFNAPYSWSGNVVIHPSYSGGLDGDFALIRLSDVIDGVPPARIAIIATLGLPLTLIGYGESGLNLNNFAKRVGQNTISNLDSTFLYFPSDSGSGICHGDSGGPAYGGNLTRCLVGVAKGQESANCAAGSPYRESRVDGVVGWILDNAGETISLCWP